MQNCPETEEKRQNQSTELMGISQPSHPMSVLFAQWGTVQVEQNPKGEQPTTNQTVHHPPACLGNQCPPPNNGGRWGRWESPPVCLHQLGNWGRQAKKKNCSRGTGPMFPKPVGGIKISPVGEWWGWGTDSQTSLPIRKTQRLKPVHPCICLYMLFVLSCYLFFILVVLPGRYSIESPTCST